MICFVLFIQIVNAHEQIISNKISDRKGHASVVQALKNPIWAIVVF